MARNDTLESSPRPAARAAAPPAFGPLSLSVLHEVILALAHGAPQERLLALLTEKARLLTDSASTALTLLEGDREHVSFAAAAGENAADLVGSRVHVADTVAGNTARTGEPYLAYQPGSGRNDGEGDGVVESAAVVPVFSEGQPVGALAALNKGDNQPYGGDDLLSLSTLAAAAAVVLNVTHLRSDNTRQARELAVLYDAVRSVAGNLGAQEVQEALIEQARAHLPSAAAAVFLLNDERTHLYIAAEYGLSAEMREVMFGVNDPLVAAVFASSRPQFLTLRDADEDEDAPRRGRLPVALPNPFPALPLRAALGAAIRSGDSAQGLLLIVSTEPPGTYTLADANLLSALAAQAAVAMDNAYLYEDANRRAEEATTLYELSQAINSSLRLDDILERVADAVLNLLAVDKFALFLHDKASDRLQLALSRGLPPGAAERLRPLYGKGIVGWVMEFETPTAVQDVQADHRNASAPLHNEGAVSLMAMPLQVGAGTIGVLCALSSRRRLFTVAEVELLYTVANQAAIAIENARVYADVRHKNVELRKGFYRVARALGSPAAPQEVPELIASLTQEVMGADRCALYSLHPVPGQDTPYLTLEASVGFRVVGEDGNAKPAPLPLTDATPTGYVAKRARSLALADLSEETRFGASPFLRPVRGRLVSYLGVPLRRGADVIGVLEVFTRVGRTWRGEEVRLLLTFASQAAVAFENARLAHERADVARSARLLRRVLLLVTSGKTPTPEFVAQTLGESTQRPVLVLRRESEERWLPLAAHGLSAAEEGALLLSAFGNTDAPPPPQIFSESKAIAVLLGGTEPVLPNTAAALEAAANLLEPPDDAKETG